MFGTEITCCSCGIKFEVPAEWHAEKRQSHEYFYCPNGHSLSFKGESDEEKLRRERDRLKQDQARLEQELADANRQTEVASKRAFRAEKATTLLKKRAAAGTCPCCQRTFSNMATHMKQQHPTFVTDTGAKVIPIKAGAK